MPRIEELYAYIAEDEGPDDEGVIAMGNMPLVGADVARVESIRAAAQAIVNATGKRVKLVRFSTRTELETLKPQG